MNKSVSLYLFPPGGINLAFVMSMVALVAGFAVFAVRRTWKAWIFPTVITGPVAYQAIIRAVETVGDWVLTTQGGRIRYYLAVILFSVVLLLATVIPDELGSLQRLSFHFNGVPDLLKGVLLVLALGATLVSILYRQHFVAALALGISGYAVAGLFLLEPAPDVALVQFIVETLATVLIVIILARTSEPERRRAIENLWDQSRSGLWRDILISVAIGTIVAIFALSAVSNRPTPNPIAAWHLENALPSLGVTDVVAGIITDFRGTDTLIEITVFGMAALGVLTMLARPNPGKVMRWFGQSPPPVEDVQTKDALQEDSERPDRVPTYRSRFSDPVTRLAATVALASAFLIAGAHLLYAGVAPGDGFTAGVIAGLGIALWYVVFGYEETKRRLRWLHPAPLIGLGMVIALGNAFLPVLFGREFLAFTPVQGFSFAGIKLASSVLFEIGIFLTVFGGVSAAMQAISHPREVEPL